MKAPAGRHRPAIHHPADTLKLILEQERTQTALGRAPSGARSWEGRQGLQVHDPGTVGCT